jgi:phenylacetate-CoA ligase
VRDDRLLLINSHEPICFPRFLPETAAIVRDIHSQLRAFERAPAAIQLELQMAQLKRLMVHARSYSPFWRERLEALPLDATAPLGMEHLQQLPVLRRADLRQSAARMRSRAPGMGESLISVAQTSGSTGTPVRVERFDPVYGPLYQAVEYLDHVWHGRDARKRMASYKRENGNVDDATWGAPFAWFETVGPAYGRNPIGVSLDSLYDLLLERRPDYLAIQSSGIRALADIAQRRCGPAPRLEQIITAYERVSPDDRILAREIFGAPIKDRYSCEECGWLALQCPRHDHYHVLGASVLIEVVNDDGSPCAMGQVGRVLVTSLHSYAMPLIRYEIGDLAAWGNPCDCGITLPVLNRVVGRVRDLVVLPDGSRRMLQASMRHAIDIDHIREYQLRQYSCGTVELQISARRALTDDERGRLRTWLSAMFSDMLPIVVTETLNVDWEGLPKRRELIRLEHQFTNAINDSAPP